MGPRRIYKLHFANFIYFLLMSNSSIFYQWNNEPDGVGIKLSDNYLNYLINKSVIKAGSFTELSRQTGISKAS